MLDSLASPLFALHLSDGYLCQPWQGLPWLVGGFVGMTLLGFAGAWRIREEEIPQIALLTAAFTVVSWLHVPLGPSGVHLLFNGLVGVVLGRRAALAIPLGLFFQAATGHGGFTTLGINSCIMVVPALLAAEVFAVLQCTPWVRRPWFRGLLVASSAFFWGMSLVFGVALVVTNFDHLSALDTTAALRIAFHPGAIAGSLLLSVVVAWLECRLENAPEFPVGLVVGELAVMLSAGLTTLVMLWGGPQQGGLKVFCLIFFVAHLPVAVVEGIVMGFLVGFLVRVKPEMLGWRIAEKEPCPADPIS